MHSCAGYVAQMKAIAVSKDLVKLASISSKVRVLIKNLSEGGLHLSNGCTDAYFSAKAFTDIGRRSYMISVNMGF